MRSWIAVALGLWALPGCGTPQFACAGDDQCTLAADGVCQPGGACSYPDPSCPSGQRYSEHAGSLGGRCVDEAGTSTSASTGPEPSSTSSSGPVDSSDDGVVDPCLDIDCGPFGVCEHDGVTPTCACEDGYVADALRCVARACPGTTCVWVDATDGDDAASGTSIEEPIQTLARAAELAVGLAPGEALVLRRGQAWDEPLALTGLQGTEDQPIIIGAYARDDGDQARPIVADGLSLEASEGIRVQDLAATNPDGTALRLSDVRHATVLRCEAFEASNGCILVRAGSEYTALVDNSVWSCGVESPVYGIGLVEQGGALGDHHWIVDNRIDGDDTTNALHVAATSADDVKTVRNYLRGSIDRGLHSRVNGHAWVVGNVIAQAGDANDAAFDHAGGGEVIVRGNVVVDAALPVVLAGEGEWAFNTVLHRGLEAAITVPAASTWTVHDNLTLAGDVPLLDVANVANVDTTHNVYGPGPGGCSFDAGAMTVDLAGWQALGQDAGSRCEAVPGPVIPMTIGSALDWDDDGWIGGVAPDAAWGGCGDPVGAFDCRGAPLAAGLPPFADIGHGWTGPPEVVERVEFVP